MRRFFILLFIYTPLTWANFVLPSSFEMKFIQVIKSEISGKEKKSKGKIEYKYPGSIRFKVEDKVSSLFISNNKTQWYYTPPFIEGEQGEVKITKSNKNLLTDLFDILKKNGLKKNDRYDVEKASTKKRLVRFNEETSKKLGIKTLSVNFQETKESFDQMKSMIIEYNDGRKVKFEVLSLKLNKDFKKDHFTFSVPPNTKIVR